MEEVSKRFQELSSKKTQSTTTTKEHTEWLQLKKELEDLRAKELSTLWLQARELTLKAQDCTKNQLLRSLKVKKQQSTIESLVDSQDKAEKNPNVMASMMVNHLSQIIEQEEDCSSQVDQAKQQVLAAIQERVSPTTATNIEIPFTKEECWHALKKLGKKKSPGWDGITTEFWLEFWEELANTYMAMLNIAFIEGRIGANIKKGLIKPIPQQVVCSKLRH